MGRNKPRYSLILLGSFSIFTSVLSANILFLIGGGNLSHKISIWPWAIALAEKGHNITFVSSHFQKPSTHPGLTDITPKAYYDLTNKLYEVDRLKQRLEGNEIDLLSEEYDNACIAFCKLTFRQNDNAELNHLIENGEFDLVVINFAFNDCGFFLSHHFGAKTVVWSPSVMVPFFHGAYGIPMEISYIPDFSVNPGSHPMGILTRMWNFYRYLKGYSRTTKFARELEELYKERFNLESVPSLSTLERNVSLVFLNSHPAVDFARSFPPMIINIGGMQCWSPVNDLPQNFQEFMDGAELGVIMITFGSTISISKLPDYYINIFFETMRRFDKVRFIWKWEGPERQNQPRNLLSSKWLPQQEILNHPKTIAFMTHGGFNSMTEATYHGVPLIVFPFFLDQNYNAFKVAAQEIGVAVEFKDFSQQLLDNAVSEILYKPKYKKNMETRSRIFKDRNMSPIEEAVYWTEFVLRNDDTSALKPMLMDQPWYTRTSFDVFAAFACLLLILPIFIAYFMIQFVKYCF